MKKILLTLVVSCVFSGLFFTSAAQARATDSYYIAGGYQQPFIFSWKQQLNSQDNIKMWPSVGGFIKVGYEFRNNADWFGLALPISWGMLKLNDAEWVHLINADIEAIFHLTQPETKFDPYFTGIVGFNFLTEGNIQDETQSIGPDAGAGFGLRYTISEYALAGSTHATNLSVFAEVSGKIILFIQDYDLSSSGTTPIIEVPARIGITYSF